MNNVMQDNIDYLLKNIHTISSKSNDKKQIKLIIGDLQKHVAGNFENCIKECNKTCSKLHKKSPKLEEYGPVPGR